MLHKKSRYRINNLHITPKSDEHCVKWLNVVFARGSRNVTTDNFFKLQENYVIKFSWIKLNGIRRVTNPQF